jgi:hypothetical protein
MNIPHLFTSQGLSQIKFLLGHLRAQDKTCKLILISHGYLQLIVGVPTNFLNVPYSAYHHWVCPSWLKSIWLFISKLNINIFMVKAWLPPKPVGNDLNQMEYFVSQRFSSQQLIGLNRCRLYLQLLSLSDMVSSNGTCIIGSILEGGKLVDRRSNLVWPEQGTPSKSDWTLWASPLRPLHSNTILKKPVSMAASSAHQSWFWYLDKDNKRFQRTSGNSWASYNLLPRKSRSSLSHGRLHYNTKSYPCHSPPIVLHAASVQERPRGILQAIPHRLLPIRTDGSCPGTTQAYSQFVLPSLSFHPFYSHLFSAFHITDAQGQAVANSIKQQTLVACSDGSFDPITRKAAFGLVFADSSTKIHHMEIQGSCIGHVDARSAMHAELSSLTAATHLLLYIIEKFEVQQGSLILYNDSSKEV